VHNSVVSTVKNNESLLFHPQQRKSGEASSLHATHEKEFNSDMKNWKSM
jgi:hypothetical protein